MLASIGKGIETSSSRLGGYVEFDAEEMFEFSSATAKAARAPSMARALDLWVVDSNQR